MAKSPSIKIVPDTDERWDLAREGDIGARNSLTEFHLPLVVQIAKLIKKKLPASVEEDDLVSYGSLGLLRAVETYDPERAKFRTYAAFKISNSIYDGLRQEDWAPKTFRKVVKDVDKHADYLYHKLQREPTDDEIGSAFGKDAEWVRTLRRTEEATHHHTLHDLEEQYGGTDAISALSSPANVVEKSTTLAQCQKEFVTWLEELPDVLKAVWYTAYYLHLVAKEGREVLGLKAFEYTQYHKQLLLSFDRMLADVRRTLD